jgi:ElaB/YqjD/DUF883 family membrane-anchored ribosome-binding protein
METYFGEMNYARSAIARKQVMQDLNSLFRHAEELLKATAGDGSEKAKDAQSRVAETLERLKASSASIQEQTVVGAKAAATRTDTVIRTHPYKSIGIALGIGLLLGTLIARK